MPAPSVQPVRNSSRVDERGFSVVEVVIAMLLLAVVAAGVAMAFVGSSKLQGTAKANASLHTAAERVFEHLRSDRSWMEPCKSSYASWCDVASMAGLSPSASVLKDASLGDSVCPGHPGDYYHNLASAQVMAIDSPGDGKGAADKDGLLPDYYRVYVKIDVWCALDKKRLHVTQPAVVDATIDPRGKIPKGTVLVEVCATTNQVDDRMSVSGCATAGASDIKEGGCPPSAASYMGMPPAYCTNPWGGVATAAPTATNPSSAVHLQRATASFTLDDGMGNTFSSGAAGVNQGDGTYLFKNIPSGTYAVTALSPPPPGLVLWETKVIPSLDNDLVVRVTVQPDVKNRALLPFRPRPNGLIRLRFKRREHEFKLQYNSSGPHKVGIALPAAKYDKSIGDIVAAYEAEMADVGNEGMINWGAEWGPCINAKLFWRRPTDPPPGNMTWKVSAIYPPGVVCMVYDLDVKFKWIESVDMGDKVFRGAVFSAGYSITPAPWLRDTQRPLASIPDYPECNEPTSLTTPGIRVPRLSWGCVQGWPTYGDSPVGEGISKVTLDKISSGLHTGIMIGGSGVPGLNQWSDTWDADRNETFAAIPDELKASAGGSIWARPRADGNLDIMGRTTGAWKNFGVNPTFDLEGKGQCWWYQLDGSRTAGPCSKCVMQITTLGGNFNGCTVLVEVQFSKCVKAVGAFADLLMAHAAGGCLNSDTAYVPIPVVMPCSAAPAPAMLPGPAVTSNCYANGVSSDPDGGSASDGTIPSGTHGTSFGPVQTGPSGIAADS